MSKSILIKTGVLAVLALVYCASADTITVYALGLPPPPVAACGSICAGTPIIGGSINGGLTVPAGQCYSLVNVTVNGGVSVQPGGALMMQGATINGGLDSTGAILIDICASTVHGPTSVQQSSSCGVIIGDANDDGGLLCAGNVLHGPVTLNANTTDVELGGNTISGPVSVNGNSGSSVDAVGGPAVGPEIEANDISGPLACNGNTPAATNDGLPNTVAGPESGECAGF